MAPASFCLGPTISRLWLASYCLSDGWRGCIRFGERRLKVGRSNQFLLLLEPYILSVNFLPKYGVPGIRYAVPSFSLVIC